MDVEDIKNHCNDKEYIMEAVKENGKFLEYASEELKNDKEIVMQALNNDAGIIKNG